MSGKIHAGAVLYAKDVTSLKAFYEATAGCEAQHVEDDHVVLQAASFQLVILRVSAEMAGQIDIEVPPRRRDNTPLKLVFFVESIAASRHAALAHGGAFNGVEKEWTFQGHRVCDGLDPEGNVVQFREHVA
ncbi:putative enzyme related to lactoylglutathione lyase [Luteibacter sp. Sphag1AF]|uniref:VOC family protein n=1 Tax=Luteibacter sp. Sphag1AF TaxID=2587031 RepID=UPI0016229B15|nr:VOC family protein [Luteibacter sp. Sphag1AF]MBB3228856.1 putative enzyme related to lactoylglutathione lyase [Luteibacter sp. Sphag1AF]